MKIIKKITSILLVAVLCIGLCGCGEQDAGESIVIGTTMAIEKGEKGEYNFDMISSSVSQVPIVYKNSDGEYVGRLVDFSTEDSKNWILTVKDYKWSDGTAFCAQDIADAINAEESFNDRFEALSISDDGKSLTLVLKSADIKFPSDLCTVRPVPSKSEDKSNTWLGPYTYTGYNKEAGTLSFTANKKFGETPAYDNVIFQIFGSEDAMYLAFKNGEIDMIWNYSKGEDPFILGDFIARDAVDIHIYQATAENLPMVLAFNNSQAPFDSSEFRAAVYYALDYEQLAEYLGSSWASVANIGAVPQSTLGYVETGANAQDLDKASSIMESMGYFKNDSGLFMKDGKFAEFTLTVNSSKSAQVSAGELIKTQLENFGIKVNLETLDTTAYQAKTTNSKSGGNVTMEAAVMSFTTAGMNMKEGLGTIYMDATHPVQGACQVTDEAFAEALLEMRNASTIDEYKIGAEDMQIYIQNNIPLIALYWDSNFYIAKETIGELTVDGFFGLNTMENFIKQ